MPNNRGGQKKIKKYIKKKISEATRCSLRGGARRASQTWDTDQVRSLCKIGACGTRTVPLTYFSLGPPSLFRRLPIVFFSFSFRVRSLSPLFFLKNPRLQEPPVYSSVLLSYTMPEGANHAAPPILFHCRLHICRIHF